MHCSARAAESRRRRLTITPDVRPSSGPTFCTRSAVSFTRSSSVIRTLPCRAPDPRNSSGNSASSANGATRSCRAALSDRLQRGFTFITPQYPVLPLASALASRLSTIRARRSAARGSCSATSRTHLMCSARHSAFSLAAVIRVSRHCWSSSDPALNSSSARRKRASSQLTIATITEIR